MEEKNESSSGEKFGTYGLAEVWEDEIKVYIGYAGNMVDNISMVNKCLANLNWPSIEELRELVSFKEEGTPDYYYEASFLKEEYDLVYKNNKSDGTKQKSI